MATATINIGGTITVFLTPREQELADMIREEVGELALNDVFNLWLTKRTEELVLTRFQKLSPQDQADFVVKMAAQKPDRGGRP